MIYNYKQVAIALSANRSGFRFRIGVCLDIRTLTLEKCFLLRVFRRDSHVVLVFDLLDLLVRPFANRLALFLFEGFRSQFRALSGWG